MSSWDVKSGIDIQVIVIITSLLSLILHSRTASLQEQSCVYIFAFALPLEKVL
jgi:hypothetical protein